jgi:hypothetical protein
MRGVPLFLCVSGLRFPKRLTINAAGIITPAAQQNLISDRKHQASGSSEMSSLADSILGKKRD